MRSPLSSIHQAGRPLFGPKRVGSTGIRLLESVIDPLGLFLSLFALALWLGESDFTRHLLLGIIVFLLTYPGKTFLQRSLWEITRETLLGWLALASFLLAFGWVTGLLQIFSPDFLLHWLWLAPATQLTGHYIFRCLTPTILKLAGHPRRAIIVGCNEQGRMLSRQLHENPLLGVRVDGYFDDRDCERLQRDGVQEPILGHFQDVSRYVKNNNIEFIYLALPMASQPRILNLLEALRDTTASIYFVPDVFLTDLIQARMDMVGYMPVVAVCDTPFAGLNGIIKRGSDIVLSILILLLISPLLLVVALLVKLSSPGPVIFRQRRYGLDGKEIVVYKFRTMTVCEDGPNIPQATKGDSRTTRLGACLRKTSIDELPQFVNVIQGRMSIVGPRPHAVAHNELYRNLIKGYMVRHKVRPGITGWAQVNGLRGETEVLEKMQARIDYDLEYLRNWSFTFDLRIILRTIVLVFRDFNAY